MKTLVKHKMLTFLEPLVTFAMVTIVTMVAGCSAESGGSAPAVAAVTGPELSRYVEPTPCTLGDDDTAAHGDALQRCETVARNFVDQLARTEGGAPNSVKFEVACGPRERYVLIHVSHSRGVQIDRGYKGQGYGWAEAHARQYWITSQGGPPCEVVPIWD